MTVTPHALPDQVDDLDGLDALDALDGLDAVGVLAAVGEADLAERRAALATLELALRWCGLHPATPDTGAAVWGDAGLPGLTDWDESLGGEGCPSVAAFAPEPFAAALGLSTLSGMQVLADALDLGHRLPATWRRVQRLEVPAWRARRLAQATHHLSQTAAAHVDTQVAGRLHSCGAVLIDRAVAQAAARFDPEVQAQREQAGRQAWDVALVHPSGTGSVGFAATSHLQATGDTGDLTRFYDLVCDHAAHLARLGDTDPLGVRKAKALGVIADAQSHLDLYGTPPQLATDDGTDGTGGTEGRVRVRRPSLAKTRMYLHLNFTDLADLADPLTRVGEVERLGPATQATIRDWLAGSRATIVPVLDMARDDPVDEHDPPEWMRETVVLRDRHCVFPWCTRHARACDLDHITPYVPIDEGGPPGQTAPTKLAPLCRRHHRAKTARRWHYQRHSDGTYTWRGPHNTSYLVTPLGTTTVPQR